MEIILTRNSADYYKYVNLTTNPFKEPWFCKQQELAILVNKITINHDHSSYYGDMFKRKHNLIHSYKISEILKRNNINLHIYREDIINEPKITNTIYGKAYFFPYHNSFITYVAIVASDKSQLLKLKFIGDN